MNNKKKNAIFGRYPCCDLVNNAMRYILNGNTDDALEELLQAVWKADGYIHKDISDRVAEAHERVWSRLRQQR